MRQFKYNRVDSGSLYPSNDLQRQYLESLPDWNKKPILLRQGRIYPEDKFPSHFLNRLIEDRVIIPVEE
ncbi:MAG: hypothetical protein EBR82_59490 [Caulobacteraceae bacterium]|nr:hypothetical protein [Caulobacteraceae bacterium]